MKHKQYILIKRYPTCPPLGTVITQLEFPFDNIYDSAEGRWNYSEIIEFPEFWKPF